MRRHFNPVNPDFIRQHFGYDVQLREIRGGWIVTTSYGGEARITAEKIDEVYGDDRIFNSVAGMAQCLWGDEITMDGPAHFRQAMGAHAENRGIRAYDTFPVSRFGPWIPVILLNFLGLWLSAFLDVWWIAPILALLSWPLYHSSKSLSKKRAQILIVQEGLHFPKHRPGDEYAQKEDFERADLF